MPRIDARLVLSGNGSLRSGETVNDLINLGQLCEGATHLRRIHLKLDSFGCLLRLADQQLTRGVNSVSCGSPRT